MKFRIVRLDTTTGELAAELSAKQGFFLADAIIYAAALSGNRLLATNDKNFENKKSVLFVRNKRHSSAPAPVF